MESPITTPDALAICGVSKRDWRMSQSRQDFPCAPRADNQKRRTWDLDHLVLLSWYDALCRSGISRPMAGTFAIGLRKAMRDHPHALRFSLYLAERENGMATLTFSSEDEAPGPGAFVMVIAVDLLRTNVEAAVSNFFAREAGRSGSDLPS